MAKLPSIVTALVVVLLLATACHEDNPTEPEPAKALSVETFLDTLSWYYSAMDSAAYAACLDSSFEFNPIPEYIPADWPFESPWDRAFELRIAGDMFHARYSPDGKRVQRIELEMTATSIADSSSGGDSLLAVTTLVDLLVVVEDPTDDPGIINYIVNGDQIFLIRYDPSARHDWLIVRQADRQPIGKAVPPFDTESSSWTRTKVLFSGYTLPPAKVSGYSRDAEAPRP